MEREMQILWVTVWVILPESRSSLPDCRSVQRQARQCFRTSFECVLIHKRGTRALRIDEYRSNGAPRALTSSKGYKKKTFLPKIFTKTLGLLHFFGWAKVGTRKKTGFLADPARTGGGRT
jgi:hypothetical protein